MGIKGTAPGTGIGYMIPAIIGLLFFSSKKTSAFQEAGHRLFRIGRKHYKWIFENDQSDGNSSYNISF